MKKNYKNPQIEVVTIESELDTLQLASSTWHSTQINGSDFGTYEGN